MIEKNEKPKNEVLEGIFDQIGAHDLEEAYKNEIDNLKAEIAAVKDPNKKEFMQKLVEDLPAEPTPESLPNQQEYSASRVFAITTLISLSAMFTGLGLNLSLNVHHDPVAALVGGGFAAVSGLIAYKIKRGAGYNDTLRKSILEMHNAQYKPESIDDSELGEGEVNFGEADSSENISMDDLLKTTN